MNVKFNVPKREYCGGPKKMVSMRMPKKLMRELEHLAKKKGWNVTELMSTIADQFIQSERRS